MPYSFFAQTNKSFVKRNFRFVVGYLHIWIRLLRNKPLNYNCIVLHHQMKWDLNGLRFYCNNKLGVSTLTWASNINPEFEAVWIIWSIIWINNCFIILWTINLDNFFLQMSNESNNTDDFYLIAEFNNLI